MSNSKEISTFSIQDMQTMAKTVVQSRMFGVDNEHQAMSLMLLCQAQGLHPMIAVQKYHIIQGRPAMKSEAMLAAFQKAGGKVRWIERTETIAEAEFSHSSGGTLKVRWTIDQAKKAGLIKESGSWVKFPRAMLSARVISEGIRAVLPSIVEGVYTPEEIQDFSEPKDVTPNTYEPEALPPYENEHIDGNIEIWKKVIRSKKKTADDIISMIETRYTLSEEQKNTIRLLDREVA